MIAKVKEGNIVLEMPVRSYLDIVEYLKQKEGYTARDGFHIKETQAAWKLRIAEKRRRKNNDKSNRI